MCCTSRIFASCLSIWHCLNSKLLPRCKSIHLGWQEDLTHQQLGGRIFYTLSGKHIPILGYPQTQENTSPGLLWLTKNMSFSESPLAFDCFLLRPPPEGKSHSPLYKNTHSHWQGPGLTRTDVKAAPGSHFVCHGVTCSKTNKSTSRSQISGNKPAWKESKWQTTK